MLRGSHAGTLLAGGQALAGAATVFTQNQRGRTKASQQHTIVVTLAGEYRASRHTARLQSLPLNSSARLWARLPFSNIFRATRLRGNTLVSCDSIVDYVQSHPSLLEHTPILGRAALSNSTAYSGPSEIAAVLTCGMVCDADGRQVVVTEGAIKNVPKELRAEVQEKLMQLYRTVACVVKPK